MSDATSTSTAGTSDLAAKAEAVVEKSEAKADAAASTAAKKVESAAATAKAEVKDVAAKAAGEDKPAPKPERSMAEIEAELDATRARLAGRIDELTDYVAPKNVLDREVGKVKGIFVDQYGGIKPDRVLMAAGAVVAVVVLLGITRRRRG